MLPAEEETEGRNPRNKQQLKEAVVKAWKSITKKNAKVWRCQWVAGLMQLLQAKDLQLNTKYHFSHFLSLCSNTFAHMKNGWV